MDQKRKSQTPEMWGLWFGVFGFKVVRVRSSPEYETVEGEEVCDTEDTAQSSLLA